MDKRTNIGRFSKRKRPNHKKALLLLILLALAILFYFNADSISSLFFNPTTP